MKSLEMKNIYKKGKHVCIVKASKEGDSDLYREYKEWHIAPNPSFMGMGEYYEYKLILKKHKKILKKCLCNFKIKLYCIETINGSSGKEVIDTEIDGSSFITFYNEKSQYRKAKNDK